MMRFSRTQLRAALIGCLFVVGGCADSSPTAPAAPVARTATSDAGQPQALLGLDLGGVVGSLPIVGSLLSPDTLIVVQRLAAIPAGVTVTQVVGSGGGVVRLPAAGLTVTIPSGALSVPTPITVTAVEGRGLVYEFGPHGIQFAKAVTLAQDMSGTTVSSSYALSTVKLQGGYYESSTDLLTSLLRAVVSELFPTRVDAYNKIVRFDIRHFSGYLIGVSCTDESYSR